MASPLCRAGTRGGCMPGLACRREEDGGQRKITAASTSASHSIVWRHRVEATARSKIGGDQLARIRVLACSAQGVWRARAQN